MVKEGLYDLDGNDPQSILVDRSSLNAQEIQEINELMAALGGLRDAEEKLSKASLDYMKLGKSDMRALHFLIVAEHTKKIVTPGMIAEHLGISTASTTKLLDRFEKAGHVLRHAHPNDRRALEIKISAKTKDAAMNTVGRVQAKRFNAAAALSSAEKRIVTKFLRDMSEQLEHDSAEWGEL